ncbi:MAG: hypothetical protein Q7K57_25705 [Burkholderiaceae bacterium]|nr:hypothetical protein [Burkholderiaceae bacterium]
MIPDSRSHARDSVADEETKRMLALDLVHVPALLENLKFVEKPI